MSETNDIFSEQYNNTNNWQIMSPIDPNKCMSRKNKKDGLMLQCPFKKKDGTFCGKHSFQNKKNLCIRIDEQLNPLLLKKYNNQKTKPVLKTKKITSIISLDYYIVNGLDKCNCESLKKTLKHYKLLQNGKKEILITRLQTHFNTLRYYHPYISNINLLQIKIKYFLKRREIQLRGPGYLNRKICNNTEDFYSFESLEEIKAERFFSYRDIDKFIYGFDIKSFYKLIEMKHLNPYNRKAIPQQAISNMNKILEKNKHKNLLDEEQPVNFTSQQKFNQEVLRIFQQIESLTSTVNSDWFISLSIPLLKKYYKSLEDIWNYRAELNLTQKIKIVKEKTMFPVTVHNFYKINNITRLRSIILQEIDKLIFTADDNSDKTLACYYVLTAFCEVSEQVRQIFPWLCQI